jgi:hypothetical protein
LPDALTDILHNSQWLLFHPRAVTPLGSSPRTRIAASVHYACSHLCICAQGDQIHHTHEASRKSDYYLPLATRGQSGSGIRSHHDHHSEEFPLVATFHCCVQPLSTLQNQGAIQFYASPHRVTCFVSLLSSSYS